MTAPWPDYGSDAWGEASRFPTNRPRRRPTARSSDIVRGAISSLANVRKAGCSSDAIYIVPATAHLCWEPRSELFGAALNFDRDARLFASWIQGRAAALNSVDNAAHSGYFWRAGATRLVHCGISGLYALRGPRKRAGV